MYICRIKTLFVLSFSYIKKIPPLTCVSEPEPTFLLSRSRWWRYGSGFKPSNQPMIDKNDRNSLLQYLGLNNLGKWHFLGGLFPNSCKIYFCGAEGVYFHWSEPELLKKRIGSESLQDFVKKNDTLLLICMILLR